MNTTRPNSLFPATDLARAARRTTALLLAAAALTIAPTDSRAASATPPDLMAYQGFLVDANGNPLAPTTPLNYPAIFRVYTASQGGTLLWSEQQIVTVDKGNFSVLLGQGTQYASELRPALSTIMGGADASDLYVSVTVTIDGSSQEILPRLRLMTSPYAFLATRAANLVQPNGTPVISYSGGQIQLTGGVNVSGTVTGNGSGLTGLTSSQIPTTLNGDRSFTGNLLMNNATSLQARNSAGAYEAVFWPRWSDNMTYLNFGSAGFNIRNNASTPVMFMQNGGNIGIGTTAPTTTLDINSSTTWRPLGVRGNGGTDMVVMGNLSARATIGAHNSAGNAWANLAINPGGGNVGIGTSTPQATLHTLTPNFTASLIESSSTIGTWNALRNTSVGGRSWQMISTGSGNGEGAGKLLIGNGSNPFGLERIGLTLEPGGRAGFNTPFPGAGLHVNHVVNAGAAQDSPFLITRASTGAPILWSRTFAAGAAYNLELFEGQAYKPGGGSWAAVSDQRLKKDIRNLDGALDSLLQLRSVTFEYKDHVAIHERPGRHNGFIAQEVEQVFPDWVSDAAGGMKSVAPVGFESLTVQALRELREEKDAQISELRQQNAALENRLRSLEKTLSAIVSPK